MASASGVTRTPTITPTPNPSFPPCPTPELPTTPSHPHHTFSPVRTTTLHALLPAPTASSHPPHATPPAPHQQAASADHLFPLAPLHPVLTKWVVGGFACGCCPSFCARTPKDHTMVKASKETSCRKRRHEYSMDGAATCRPMRAKLALPHPRRSQPPAGCAACSPWAFSCSRESMMGLLQSTFCCRPPVSIPESTVPRSRGC